jgi:hypothetical protein
MKYSISEVGSTFVENGVGEIDVIDDRMIELVEGCEDESDYDFWVDGDGFEWLESVEKTGGEWIGETYKVVVRSI